MTYSTSITRVGRFDMINYVVGNSITVLPRTYISSILRKITENMDHTAPNYEAAFKVDRFITMLRHSFSRRLELAQLIETAQKIETARIFVAIPHMITDECSFCHSTLKRGQTRSMYLIITTIVI